MTETQTETKYGMRKAEQREQLPDIDLLPLIPHNGKKLDVAIFGPNTYRTNLDLMGKVYFHSRQLPNISFKPATTSESISAAASGFGSNGEVDAKRDILDPGWLQTGDIVRTQDGVFTNTTVIDETSLKQFLDGAEKVNGIYLLNGGIGFAPYESFEIGAQDCITFAHGGLARALEHTPEKVATKLGKIASPKFYKGEINVICFDPVEKPISRVASLYSNSNIDGNRLHVDGYYRYDVDGYAFGVFEKTS